MVICRHQPRWDTSQERKMVFWLSRGASFPTLGVRGGMGAGSPARATGGSLSARLPAPRLVKGVGNLPDVQTQMML